MATTNLHFEDLKILLQCPSKDIVIKICNDIMKFSGLGSPEPQLKLIGCSLKIDKKQSENLYIALNLLLKKAIFADTQNPEVLRKLFPANFHNNLKELLVKIIIDNYSKWREASIKNQVSLPHLVDFDWRVDLKAASNTISRMSVPTCLVQFEMQDAGNRSGTAAPVRYANVELSKETLNTMLDGLSKIRDQLSSVAKQG
ncbi:COMM domain-containing protein 9 isoform X1 [Octopus bimaculoides]|nr:COMM domain-containing protein 9 isoform X1 [Octopus bimaculoides]|eukprot:XP_014770278.1 PREDICTED: COMM domain-containing protein 9-like isoform X1 [Octopus bimaculoides]